MAEKYWTESEDRGVNNSCTVQYQNLLNIKNQANILKTDQTQYIDCANKKLNELTI